MLPTVMTAKSTMIAALTALSIAAIPATPALAWGEKEQNFLAGVITAVIVGEVIKNSRRANAAPAPAPVYVDPRPSYTSIYRTPAALAFNTYSAAERQAIQRSLRATGYYRGSLDGSFGPGTYNAIVAYARDEGITSRLASTGSAYAVYDGLIF